MPSTYLIQSTDDIATAMREIVSVLNTIATKLQALADKPCCTFDDTNILNAIANNTAMATSFRTDFNANVPAIRNSITVNGELYTLINEKDFTFDDADIITAIEANTEASNTLKNNFNFFANQNIEDVKRLLLCCIESGKRQAPIPSTIITDDFGDTVIVEPPVVWQDPPILQPTNDCDGMIEISQTVLMTFDHDVTETKQETYRCIEVPATGYGFGYRVNKINANPKLPIPDDEYRWRLVDGSTSNSSGHSGVKVNTFIHAYVSGFTNTKWIRYNYPVQYRTRNSSSDPWGAWVMGRGELVGDDIGTITLCLAPEPYTPPVAEPNPEQLKRCKRARWFVANARRTLSDALDAAYQKRDDLLDLSQFLPELVIFQGMLSTAVREVLLGLSGWIGGSLLAGDFVLWLTDRIVSGNDGELLGFYDGMAESLVCAVFESTDQASLWHNWRNAVNASVQTGMDDRDKYVFRELVTNEVAAWYHSRDGIAYIEREYGGFTDDCSACPGWED